jgi:hypothetical protein
MKTTTLAISRKGRTLMPLDWRKQNALGQGGSGNAFYPEDGGRLIVPVKPPEKGELKRLLARVRRVKPPADRKRRVAKGLEEVRR